MQTLFTLPSYSFYYVTILHLPWMNVVEMKFLYFSSKPPHKQISSLGCSTFFPSIGHHHPSSSLAPYSSLANPLFQTGLQHSATSQPATLHCFNWSSTLCHSSLLQLVFNTSLLFTASTGFQHFATPKPTGFHCFNWSFRHLTDHLQPRIE